ncbi:hypothetical protein [Acetobacter persici]|uniref:Uncharacterized protein n=1 Tax=Acetobacter persici TaxID=1076596 RepID=A0A1U9LIS4_9PROT|nr:hypothetical protein [Acetobacter persici]AQT06298.1 hypothetical protein A0U91_14830 [Acetobacter persici]
MTAVEYNHRIQKLSFTKVMVLYSVLSLSLNISSYLSKLEVHREIPFMDIQNHIKNILPAQKGPVSVSRLRIAALDKTKVNLSLSGTYLVDRQKLPYEASATADFSYSGQQHTLALTGIHLQHAMLGGMTYQGDDAGQPQDKAYTIPDSAFDGFPAYILQAHTIKDLLASSTMSSIAIKGAALHIALVPSPFIMLAASITSSIIFLSISVAIALVVWREKPPRFASWIVGAKQETYPHRP